MVKSTGVRCPPLRVREVDGRVRLGLEGFGDVEGATLQEAADELVTYLLRVSMSVRAGGVGPLCSECAVEISHVEFLWELGEAAAAGRDDRRVKAAGAPH